MISLMFLVVLVASPCEMSHNPANEQELWASLDCPLSHSEHLDKSKVVKQVGNVKLYKVVNEDPATAAGNLWTGSAVTFTHVTMKCYKYWPLPDITIYELAILLPVVRVTVSGSTFELTTCMSGDAQLITDFETTMGVAMRHFKVVHP